ncbi:MAG: Fe(3+) ABC transporter substrate-binding protein, partial [Bacteroidota bacterium]
EFEKETGIEVRVVKAKADELIQKMEIEGAQCPADLLLTVDAGRLVRAKNKGLLQAANASALTNQIPAHLRDADNEWFGLTKRARVIVYDKEEVQPAQLSTYEALAAEEWNDDVLIRSSGNIYNQSLLASIIANLGKDAATDWAKGVVNNFARTPKGNDRDQVKAIAAGEGQLAVINSYYLGRLLNSEDAAEVEAGQAVGIFFPNQADRGTHINVSGIGIAKHAPHAERALQFITFLTRKDVQERFAGANYEYPVHPEAEPVALLQSWGSFKEDNLPLQRLGENNKAAVVLFDEVGWP